MVEEFANSDEVEEIQASMGEGLTEKDIPWLKE